MQVGTTMEDQIDLLKEQSKMLAGDVAFCTSSLKRLIEQAMNSSDDTQLQVNSGCFLHSSLIMLRCFFCIYICHKIAKE